METAIDLKKLGAYLIIPFVLSLLLITEPGAFIIIGIVQFFVGLIQVTVALIKTIVYAFNKSSFPEVLKYYWIAVSVYFIAGIIGVFILEYLEIEKELVTKIALVYFALAWTIALYHFKHIMLLKL